ncbi:c-type cytochrome [Stieleria sp. ICT_E10.1]|uniref:c-type cytochrome n=1 Tax=Stieleria sedimenti TaxID=2976331 RepID=UPI0021805055|nr:c-type cytochrome [Stieleria sedimenti]MCS7469221.1 c-type cytochrome [Stieleria sedimenti]
MRLLSRFFIVVVLVQIAFSASCLAKDAEPPTIFLDKSPRIVAYQLGRLNDERLLLVPRSTDDKKYIPVYEAIVGRPAMAAGIRDEAFQALAKLKDSSVAAEMLATITNSKRKTADEMRLVDLLTGLMLKRPAAELTALQPVLSEVAGDDDPVLGSIALAGLITAGDTAAARSIAKSDAEATVALLAAIRKLPNKKLKVAQRDYAVDQLESADSLEVKLAAIDALSRIPADQGDTYQRLITQVDDPAARFAACRGLMRLPPSVFQADSSLKAAEALVAFAEVTPAAERTTDAFIDAMQLVDRLLTKIPPQQSRALRSRLREVTVRVVKIGTVEEEMRYDVPYFAVEAGRPVQILLENHDLMPHNLVITQPGALKGVAMAGLAAGPQGTGGLPYVPDSPNVIAASEMVAPDSATRITLTAPSEPGEYPYVCTFPQHWYRMYGVMVVVDDLDAWNQNPVEPANPLGSTRSFVQAWTLEDFAGSFDSDLRGRSPEIGEKVFNEASCVGCHKINNVGGAVGPELTDTYTKWKSDHLGILREILVPSHKIDSKYAMQIILTVDGKTLSGIVVDENDDTVTLLTNPEAKEPVIILQDDIEVIKRSATSMMPKALMDQYSQDEVLDLMAYLKSVDEAKEK